MRWLSGLNCNAVSKFQRGTRFVEPKTRTSEKRCVNGTPSGVTRWSL